MISTEEVQGLAELARLDLSEAEVASLQTDISNILEYVGQVSAVSDSRRAPSAVSAEGALLLHNVLRADVSRELGDAMAVKEEKLKDAFPKREGGYNVVRKIIQKDE